MSGSDDDSRLSYDSILRTGLEPDAATASRIVAKALASSGRRAPSLHLLVAAAALVGFAIWTAGRDLPRAERTTLVSGPGGIVVLRTARGAVGLYQNAQPARTKQLLIQRGGAS